MRAKALSVCFTKASWAMSDCRATALAVLGVAMLTGAAMPAQAQTYGSLFDKVNRLEQQVQNMNREMMREGRPISGTPTAMTTAQLEVRLSQLEEQLRLLTGQVEEYGFAVSAMQQKLAQNEAQMTDKLFALEDRVNAMAMRAPVAAPSPAGMPAVDPAVDMTGDAVGVGNAIAPALTPPAPQGEVVGTIRSNEREQPSAVGSGAYPTEPKAHYNHAFRLLNQAKFVEARTALEAFVKRYPDDALVGNAYYWLGETYYVDRNYLRAADQFRQGYQEMPNGSKAPDNLLKLGMSLSAMNKTDEACVVYGQLFSAFPSLPSAIKQKMNQERNRLGCSG